MKTRRNTIAAAALATATTLAGFASVALTTGCDLMRSALPVIADLAIYAQDAATILDLIDSLAHRYFAAHPDPALEDTFTSKMAACRLGVDAAIRSAKGVNELDDAKTDAAFAQFRVAYDDLRAMLVQLGIQTPSGRIASAPGSAVAIPQPLAISHHRASK